jgi:hypothetical protein
MRRVCARGAPVGYDRGDPESSVPAVHREVGVEGHDAAVGMLLGHADQTSVGQRHRDARIPRHEPRHMRQVVLQMERDSERAARQQLHDRRGPAPDALHEETRLRDHGFARPERDCCVGEMLGGPAMVWIPPVEERNQRARVNERPQDQRPYLRRWRGLDDKSTGPERQPARSPAIAPNERGREVRSRVSSVSSARRTMTDFFTRRRAATAVNRAASEAGTFTESSIVRLLVIRKCHNSNTSRMRQIRQWSPRTRQP